VACGGTTAGPTSDAGAERKYPVTFTCGQPDTPQCPQNATCPELPLGVGCDDLPGVFKHPKTPVSVGRPVGCTVFLSYDSDFYPGQQQTCTCRQLQDKPFWSCPV